MGPSCWHHSSSINFLVVPVTGQARSQSSPASFLTFSFLFLKYSPSNICLEWSSLHSGPCWNVALSQTTAGSISLKEYPTTFDAITLLSLQIMYLFYIYLLNFFLHKKLKSVRVWKLCLISCHIVHIERVDFCVWGGIKQDNHVMILPQCQLLNSNCVLLFVRGRSQSYSSWAKSASTCSCKWSSRGTTAVICFCGVCGRLPVTVAQRDPCGRDCMVCKDYDIYHLLLYRKQGGFFIQRKWNIWVDWMNENNKNEWMSEPQVYMANDNSHPYASLFAFLVFSSMWVSFSTGTKCEVLLLAHLK